MLGDFRSRKISSLKNRQEIKGFTLADGAARNEFLAAKTRFVEFDEIGDLPRAEHFFLNVNTPEDHRAAQAALAKTL